MRLTSVLERCHSIRDRVIFDPYFSSTHIDELHCAIIFVHAFWSGPSVQTFVRIVDLIGSLDNDAVVTLVVCDIDEIEPVYSILYAGDRTGGNGDLIWVSNGVVRARHNSSRECDFRTTTESLLAACKCTSQDVG